MREGVGEERRYREWRKTCIETYKKKLERERERERFIEKYVTRKRGKHGEIGRGGGGERERDWIGR